MAAPSKPFDSISDAEIDPDSPITSGLLTKYRNRDDHLEEWLGASFVAAVDHDHDGVNSKKVIADLLPKKAEDLTIRTTTSATFADLSGTPITYTAAELAVNRESLVSVLLELNATADAEAEFVITVDGTDQQIVKQFITASTPEAITLVGQNTLVSGANRIIKVRFRRVSGSGTVQVVRSFAQTILTS